MAHPILIIILLICRVFTSGLSNGPGDGQTVAGTVFDSETKLPIPNVLVYFDGTTNAVLTNEAGEFRMKPANRIRTRLVVMHVAYETLYIDDPYEKETHIIYLVEKPIEIDEVAVTAKASRYTREQRVKAFETQFLGDNKAGKSCVIENKDDILIYFDEEQQTLFASCDKPVIVINNYSGYKTHFSLTDFQIRYKGKSLNVGQIAYVVLRGSVFFEDIASLNPLMKKRRKDISKESLNYFFKNLANNTLRTSLHSIYNHRNYSEIKFVQQAFPELIFDITTDGTEKRVRIKDNPAVNRDTDNPFKFPLPITCVITVCDPNGGYSELIFLTDEFTVDTFGNIDKKDYIYVTGPLGSQRAGSMLPLDVEFLNNTYP